MITVTYVYHSGFVVETDGCLLVFDYYLGNITLKDKKTLVFVSHRHGDHFNPQVFNWQQDRTDFSYILSDDIGNYPSHRTHRMAPCEQLVLGDITIKSFGSTDLGVSYLVHVEGKTIFHAGDLNWWHWSESPLDEQQAAEKAFNDVLAKIDNFAFDLAFFPVDPRLGDHAFCGGLRFIERFQPKVFFPMHFRDNHQITRAFAQKNKQANTRCMVIERKNHVFHIS